MDLRRVENNEVLFWLDDTKLYDIPTSGYWNDEEEEKKKDYYFCGKDGQKLIAYLKEKTTYYHEYESTITFINKLGLQISGTGIDLAAGVCWTTAFLSRINTIERIYAVDISKHRILKIAPNVLSLFNADTSKISRVVGSFCDIKLRDNSMDFCFMGQAFHHAADPSKLLSEVYRVLKPDGFVAIIGETPVTCRVFLREYAKNIIKISVPWMKYKSKPVYKIFPGIMDLFPPDRKLGDYRYGLGEYRAIFKANGFSLRKNRQRLFTTFVAVKARRRA